MRVPEVIGPWFPPLKEQGDLGAVLTIKWHIYETENQEPDARAQLPAVLTQLTAQHLHEAPDQVWP